MRIKIIQIDGKFPNLALMKISHFHKRAGDEVVFSEKISRDIFEGKFDRIYASSIFKFSDPARQILLREYPDAIVGGTGTDNNLTVEKFFSVDEYEHYDYGIYPDFKFSIGFTQRGCRLSCKFCVVPKKEGSVRSVSSLEGIWRKGYPKKIILLDNDFFGQENWREVCREAIDGNFSLCLSQGINLRKLTDENSHYLAKMKIYDNEFKKRRIYTAWDNLKDETIFFEGLKKLSCAGINLKTVMVYMLIGYDKNETFERIMYRFLKMVESGVMPYPMPFDQKNKLHKKFQRWVVRGYYRYIPWENYMAPQNNAFFSQ